MNRQEWMDHHGFDEGDMALIEDGCAALNRQDGVVAQRGRIVAVLDRPTGLGRWVFRAGSWVWDV